MTKSTILTNPLSGDLKEPTNIYRKEYGSDPDVVWSVSSTESIINI